MAVLAVAAVGSAIGGAVFGAGVLGVSGATIGYLAGSMLASSFAPRQKFQGPRQTDMQVTGSAYGAPIDTVYGHPVVAGQIVYASPKREIATTVRQGKGGGGSESTTYTYEVDVLILLSNNPIVGVRRIWFNGGLVATAAADATTASLKASLSSPHWRRLTVYKGDALQMPDPTYEAAVTSAYADAYRGRGSVFIEGLQLGSGGNLPNTVFELAAAGVSVTTGPRSFFAPLTANDQDTIAPLATLVVSTDGMATPVYDANGMTVSGLGAYYLQYWHSKFNTPAGIRHTYQCEFSMPFGGYTNWDIVDFFVANAAPNGFFSWQRRQAPGGVNDVWIGRLGPSVYIGPHDWSVPHHFRIVFRADADLVDWDMSADGINWVTKYTAVAARQNYRVLLSASSGLIDGDPRFRNLKVYTGDSDTSYTTFDNTPADLDDVVSDLCARSGLPASAYDVTALTAQGKTVQGLATQVNAARGVLDTLASTHFFTASLSDKIYFRPLGAAPVATIPYKDMGWAAGGSDPEPSMGLVQGNELEIPAQTALTYANMAADYEPDTQYSDRLLTGQISTNASQTPVVLSPTEAKKIVDTQVVMGALRATSTTITLGLEYAHIEPGDVIMGTAEDGSVYRLAVDKRADADGVLTFDLVLDDASIYTQAGTTTGGASAQTSVLAVAETDMELLDIPMLRDSDNQAGHYVAVAGKAANWTNAAVYYSPDDVSYAAVVAISDQAVIGTCSTALPPYNTATGVHNVFDESATLTVNVGAGELESVTRDLLLTTQNINAAMAGNELIRFREATLVSAGVYTLRGLLRGRRGTDNHTGGHVVGERFALLSEAGLRFVPLNGSDLGGIRYYKGASGGQTLTNVTAETITPMGVNLRPYAPVGLRVDRANADHVLSWMRRTRLATRLVGPLPITAPIGEATEAYEVDIFADYATATAGTPVLRTIMSTSPNCTYTAAQRVADGTGSSEVFARVYQISAVIGRGYSTVMTA